MKLSIALCTFNGARYLAEQLASLALQTRPPDEIVIGDDQSTDGTRDIIEAFAAAGNIPVKWLCNPNNLGSTQNFASTIERCSGDVIFLCDQDDVWHPEKLERFEAIFCENPEVSLVASDLEVISAAGRPTGRRMWSGLPLTPTMRSAFARDRGGRQLLRFNVLTGAALAFRSSLRDTILPIPEGWLHDHWIAIIAAAFSAVRLIELPLTFYRQHAAQQIGPRDDTLVGQWRSVRKRSLQQLARRSQALLLLKKRLELHDDRLIDQGLPAQVELACQHAQSETQLLQYPRLQRIYPALKSALAGHYHRFGRGWKSFLATIFCKSF